VCFGSLCRWRTDKFSFLSYEWGKQTITSPDDTDKQTAMKVLLCGGIAGIVTWATIFPLDVIKTRVQTQVLKSPTHIDGERGSLLPGRTHVERLDTFQIAREAYRTEGASVFWRGLGICSVRAFVVNAVQWAVYEWMMRLMQQQ
jgi:solute carrier family 25 carnitine/acylcarnitine transporter 20/29